MKNLKYGIFLMLGVVLVMLQGCTSMKKSNSLQDVVAIVDQHLEAVKPEEILVLFDINYTLTYLPNIPMSLLKKYYEVWAQEVRALPKDQQDLVQSWNVKNNPNIILDPKALDVLADLRKRGIKAIAFTAILAGNFDGKGPAYQHVYDEIKSLEISFEHSFPKVKDVVFTDMLKYHNAHPMYYKGILFANGEASGVSKGDVLVHFLKHIGYTPKVVIIADDRKDNITGLETALAAAYPEMQLEGLEYLYAFTLPVPNMSKDEFRSYLQNVKAKALAR